MKNKYAFDFDSLFEEQIARAQRTKQDLPYFILTRGPTLKCPLHGKNECLVLPIDHKFWKTFRPRTIVECKCNIRQVSIWEFKKLKKEGCQDPDAPAILDKNGLMTGHREKRKIPIKLEPS